MSTLDPTAAAGLTDRQVRSASRDGRPTKQAVARRRYRAGRAEVWDALTDAERLPRWFLPVTGDLREGGRYQLEGNAGGTIERCEPPQVLAVTWEYGGEVSWVQVCLDEADGWTTLELTHEAHVDPDTWRRFGPGATGIGWDLAFHGLERHLETGDRLDPAAAQAWASGPEGVRFVQAASTDWARAAIDDGDDPGQARAAGEATLAFYTAPPAADPEG